MQMIASDTAREASEAMRSILPTGFNELIGLAKSTSMVYVLALPELFYTVQVIYRRNLEVIPLLMAMPIPGTPLLFSRPNTPGNNLSFATA